MPRAAGPRIASIMGTSSLLLLPLLIGAASADVNVRFTAGSSSPVTSTSSDCASGAYRAKALAAAAAIPGVGLRVAKALREAYIDVRAGCPDEERQQELRGARHGAGNADSRCPRRGARLSEWGRARIALKAALAAALHA